MYERDDQNMKIILFIIIYVQKKNIKIQRVLLNTLRSSKLKKMGQMKFNVICLEISARFT